MMILIAMSEESCLGSRCKIYALRQQALGLIGSRAARAGAA